MRKLIAVLFAVIFSLAFVGYASAIEVNILGVVNDGKITATGEYRVFNGQGEGPLFENQASFNYSIRGVAGLSITGNFAGTITTQQQLEVQSGYGYFENKVGTGTLVNTLNEETGITTGILNQNAIGFGGTLTSGVVATGISNEQGFVGVGEVQGAGTFKAGAIDTTITGTSEPGVAPIVVEQFETHVVIGPADQIQGRIEFTINK